MVAIARSWIGTNYHHLAKLKGVGVDCAQLLVAVYAEAGLVTDIDVGHYPSQWHLHFDEEKYLTAILQHAHEVTINQLGPGDIVLWKFGRCFSHAGIVIDWPHVIHARAGHPVCIEDAHAAQWLEYVGEGDGRPRPKRFFSLW